jgi:hypothetical protein
MDINLTGMKCSLGVLAGGLDDVHRMDPFEFGRERSRFNARHVDNRIE